MNEPIHLDLDAPVATIWLNRPASHNAVSRELRTLNS